MSSEGDRESEFFLRNFHREQDCPCVKKLEGPFKSSKQTTGGYSWSKCVPRNSYYFLVDRFLIWSKENSMICNPSKCKEIIFRKKGFIQDIVQVNNIPQCTKPILGITFEENCK